MAINPRIKQKAEDIRKKIFGTEVRESLASGIEAISEDVEATIGRQDYVEEQFQNVIDETTDKDVISAPELIAARNGKSNLKTRLDDEHAQVTAQLAQTMTQEEFDSWVATILDGGPSIFFETLTALETAYPNGASGVALVRETDPAHIYIWNGTEWEDFGAYQGVEVKDGTVKPQSTTFYDEISIVGENIIKNGNFSAIDPTRQGTALGFNLGADVTNKKVENNRQYWTGNTTGHGSALITLENITVVVGDKYYVGFEGENVGDIYFYKLIHSVTEDSRASFIFSPVDPDDRLSFRVRVPETESSVSNLIVINLTKTFGVGKEPSVDEIDSLLTQFPNNWFDGKANLFQANWALDELRRLNVEKANKGDISSAPPVVEGGQSEISLRRTNGSVSLWYDDGLSSMYPTVYDNHAKYGVPGTAVIITNKLNTTDYLTEENLKTIANSPLWVIGSHSENHVNLPAQTESRIKTELLGSYNTLKSLGVIQDFCPFVAPALMYNSLAYRYAYLLYPYIRDYPDLLLEGQFYSVPNASSFVSYGSYEIGTRQGKTVEQMLKEIQRFVNIGYHVPLMLHGVDNSGDPYTITPEQHDELLDGLVRLNIPIVFPETTLKKHNLVYDSLMELGEETWSKDSRDGVTAFETQSSKIFFGNKSAVLGWKGVGNEPRLRPLLNIPVEPDTEYKITWWALGDGTEFTRTYAEAEFLGGMTNVAKVEILGSQKVEHVDTPLTTAYQRFSGTITTPKGAQYVRLRLGVDFKGNTTETNVWTWLDAITFHQADLPEYNK